MNDRFTTLLLDWFRENRRELPWRQTRDPYAIWLSEVILQQTRIVQGTDYWLRFLRRFPTVETLAAADEDEVLLLWQGLGYYSRARNLHAAARQIVRLGHFPKTCDEWKAIKGVGDYTAAAVASFAFTALANQLLPKGQSAAFNAALMDFGSLQCTPKSPDCQCCPLVEQCVACREGRVEELPVKANKTKIKVRHLTYLYIRCGGFTAIHRRGPGDIWQGLWEPLLFENEPLPKWKGQLTLLAKDVKHQLTHRTLFADFYVLETDVRPSLPDGYVWIREDEEENYACPQLIEKIRRKYLFPDK